MTDYYSILGISKTADEIEIKAAFRRLAKIYHPDKNPDNPEAKHLFQNILKAYNTLVHPSSRRRYDLRGEQISQPTKTPHSRHKTQKEWTFTEEELQRRQYYEKHYKAKQQERAKHHTPSPKAHSDYKYILFATPVAVALLMLIISMFTETPKTIPLKELPAASVQNAIPEDLTPSLPVNGTIPYEGYFKGIQTFNTPYNLEINNSSKYDAVVVICDKKTNRYLQHVYLGVSYTVVFSKLPETGVYWKCMLGKNWNKNKLLMDEMITGGFDSIVQYQTRKLSPTDFKEGESAETALISVIKPTSKAKKYISNEREFFEK